MRKVDTWMPLYVADYLADTMRLTCEQHGAYLLLIMDYWRNGPPPDDDAVLAQITRCTTDQWKKIRPVIAKHFAIENGSWTHGRVDKELESAKEKSAAAGAKAKAAADARWNPSRNATSMPGALPQGELEVCPSPSPSQSTKPSMSDKSDAAVPYQKIVDLYHEYMTNNPKCKVLTADRKRHIAARWKQSMSIGATPFKPSTANQPDLLRQWDRFFEICTDAPFLMNRTAPSMSHPNFKVDIDWMMNEANFVKILENKYHRGNA